MTVAKVEPPSADKLKFVVGSKIDRSSSLYLKGNREFCFVVFEPGKVSSA